MKSQASLPTLLALICFLLPLKASAESEPAWMKEITRLPAGDHANLRPVKLDYSLAWNNRVNAGKLEISIVRSNPKNGRFIGDASGRSTGFARILWPYDFTARSVVDGKTLRPINFQLSDQERNEATRYDIVFEPRRQVYTTISRKKNEEPRTSTARFRFDYGQDLLSSAFYLRSQPLKTGDEISMLVTPFNRPYLAEFTVAGRDVRKVKGTEYKAIRLEAKVGRVNQDLTLREYEKIRKTTLWVSDDEYRIPLELQSDISVGFVSARLNELQWLD